VKEFTEQALLKKIKQTQLLLPMKTFPLIGLYSIRPNSTSCRAVTAYLRDKYQFEIVHFSETSKILAMDLLIQIGYDTEEANQLISTNRHKHIEDLNIDGKSLVEQLDCLLRGHILSNYSLISVEKTLERLTPEKGIVIEDVRNYSQAKFIQDRGGLVIRVDETNINGANDYLKDFKFDKFIVNDSGQYGLYRNIDLTLADISENVLEPLAS